MIEKIIPKGILRDGLKFRDFLLSSTKPVEPCGRGKLEIVNDSAKFTLYVLAASHLASIAFAPKGGVHLLIQIAIIASYIL